ncbi:hypothetical protein ACTMU2_39370 [Cupriavidus basilensis]
MTCADPDLPRDAPAGAGRPLSALMIASSQTSADGTPVVPLAAGGRPGAHHGRQPDQPPRPEPARSSPTASTAEALRRRSRARREGRAGRH